MAKETKIEWADATFNPWIGCERISRACDNCYAADWAARHRPADKLWAGNRYRTSQSNWQQPIKWDHDALRRGQRRRVFCASLGDVFDNAVPETWRADLFRLIRSTPNLDWLLLTKRIGLADRMIYAALAQAHLLTSREPLWPWPNVWLGATVVTQDEAERDVPKLLATRAARRFVSIEPMLEPINLRALRTDPLHAGLYLDALAGRHYQGHELSPDEPQALGVITARLDWVIAGGESGPKARPSPAYWYRWLRDQCAATGTPYLFKQWGEWIPAAQVSSARVTEYLGRHRSYAEGWTTRPSERCFRFGKAEAGRLLDDRAHDGIPA